MTQRAVYSDTGGDNGFNKNCLEKKNRLVSLEWGVNLVLELLPSEEGVPVFSSLRFQAK